MPTVPPVAASVGRGLAVSIFHFCMPESLIKNLKLSANLLSRRPALMHSGTHHETPPRLQNPQLIRI